MHQITNREFKSFFQGHTACNTESNYNPNFMFNPFLIAPKLDKKRNSFHYNIKFYPWWVTLSKTDIYG